jgi:hypothetical protein
MPRFVAPWTPKECLCDYDDCSLFKLIYVETVIMRDEHLRHLG